MMNTGNLVYIEEFDIFATIKNIDEETGKVTCIPVVKNLKRVSMEPIIIGGEKVKIVKRHHVKEFTQEKMEVLSFLESLTESKSLLK